MVLNLVTLPTELPVQETLELYENLDREHRIQLGRLYVNQVPSEPLTYQALSVVDDLSEAALRAGDVELGDDIALGRAALRRFGRVRDQLKRLAARVRIPVVELPRLTTGEVSLQELERLGRMAAGEAA